MSFGSSPITTSTAAPARNPVITAFERNRAIHPIRKIASRRNSSSGRERDRGNQLRRLLAAELGEQNRATRHGRERRARSGGNLARRAEERIDDRAGGRGVQPVLQRYACDAGVPEVLRDDQRRDGDASRQIPAQPPTLVARQPRHHWHAARERADLRIVGWRGHEPRGRGRSEALIFVPVGASRSRSGGR